MQHKFKITVSFPGDSRGSVIVVFALLLPIVLLLIGGGVDFAVAVIQRQKLQAIVDNAALSAARELSLADSRSDNVMAVVAATVRAAATGGRLHSLTPTVQTSVRTDPAEVSVAAQQEAATLFGGAFGLVRVEIQAEAVARIVGQPHICVLTLEESESGAISMKDNSSMKGENCSVFSNSLSKTGIAIKDGAAIDRKSVV